VCTILEALWLQGASLLVALVVAMGKRSSTAVLVLLGTLLLVGCLDGLEAGQFSEEDLAE
jgi:hypothetical protein